MAHQQLLCNNALTWLKRTSTWPKTDNLHHFYLLFAIRLITYVPQWSGNLLHLIAVTKEEQMVGIYKDMTIVSAIAGIHYVLFMFVRKIRPCRVLLENMSNFDKFGKPEKAEEINRMLGLATNAMSYYIIFMGIGFLLFAMLTISNCEKNDAIGTVCGVLFPILYPFDTDFFPAREIAGGLQLYALVFLYLSAASIFSMYVTICVNLKLRFRHLQRLLREVFDAEGYLNRRRKLHFCVRYHNDILEMCALCDDCFMGAMGVAVNFDAVVFGCICLEIMNEYSILAVGQLFGWLGICFVSCYFANEVKLESVAVAQAACQSKWYEAEMDLRKDLLIVIMRAQRPFIMHAFPLSDVTLEFFVGIIKTAYSILSVLANSY